MKPLPLCLLGTLLTLTPLSSPRPAAAVIAYSIAGVNLNVADYWPSDFVAFNNSGQIVVTAYKISGYGISVFLYDKGNGTMRMLDSLVFPGNRYGTIAHDMNNSGQIVGRYGFVNAFLASSNGPMQALGTLGGDHAEAYGINDHGQVVGWAQLPSSQGSRAFLYNGSGPLVNLNDLIDPSAGWTLSTAYVINNLGQIIGSGTSPAGQGRVFLYNGSEPLQDLSALGVTQADTCRMNDLGQIVGSFDTGTYDANNQPLYHAFLYDGSGPLLDLGTLGGNKSHAWGINNFGQIVGAANLADSSLHAFLYNGNGPMVDLNDLIDPSLGWTLAYAYAINDLGQIVGSGTDPAGQYSTCILTPLPEPATLSLTLAAAPLLLRRPRQPR